MTSRDEVVDSARRGAERARAGATQLVVRVGWGFLGSCLSVTDVVAAVLASWDVVGSSGVDRLVLSKGHAAPALYAAALDDETLRIARYATHGSPLQGHPRRGSLPWVRTTTGSLGLGIPHAIGELLAHRRSTPEARLAIIVGDGEIESGIALESLSLIGDLDLRGVVVLVDRNDRQASKRPSASALRAVQAMLPVVSTINGHDLDALVGELRDVRSNDVARLVVCSTVPGRGVGDPQFASGRMGHIPSRTRLHVLLGSHREDEDGSS